MLGCNESSSSANLGNSGEAMVEIHKYSVKQETNWPLQEVFTLQWEIHYQQQGGELYRQFLNFRRENTVAVAKIPGRRGTARATHAQFYHVTVRRMTKHFVQRCQSILYSVANPFTRVYTIYGYIAFLTSAKVSASVNPACATPSLNWSDSLFTGSYGNKTGDHGDMKPRPFRPV